MFLKVALIDFLKKSYRSFKRVSSFTTSGEYWEDRYKKGGNSGSGSFNSLAKFKSEVVNEFVSKNGIKSVVEFGCGDGNQLRLFKIEKYVGYDISNTAISICENIYKNDTSKQFKSLKSYENEMADLTLSLDVIYHLVEDDVYINYMKKLFASSKRYVIIYSTNQDESNTILSHVRHRKFTDWINENARNFKLVKKIPNKYSFDGNLVNTSSADFYIYQKSG